MPKVVKMVLEVQVVDVVEAAVEGDVVEGVVVKRDVVVGVVVKRDVVDGEKVQVVKVALATLVTGVQRAVEMALLEQLLHLAPHADEKVLDESVLQVMDGNV